MVCVEPGDEVLEVNNKRIVQATSTDVSNIFSRTPVRIHATAHSCCADSIHQQSFDVVIRKLPSEIADSKNKKLSLDMGGYVHIHGKNRSCKHQA